MTNNNEKLRSWGEVWGLFFLNAIIAFLVISLGFGFIQTNRKELPILFFLLFAFLISLPWFIDRIYRIDQKLIKRVLGNLVFWLSAIVILLIIYKESWTLIIGFLWSVLFSFRYISQVVFPGQGTFGTYFTHLVGIGVVPFITGYYYFHNTTEEIISPLLILVISNFLIWLLPVAYLRKVELDMYNRRYFENFKKIKNIIEGSDKQIKEEHKRILLKYIDICYYIMVTFLFGPLILYLSWEKLSGCFLIGSSLSTIVILGATLNINSVGKYLSSILNSIGFKDKDFLSTIRSACFLLIIIGAFLDIFLTKSPETITDFFSFGKDIHILLFHPIFITFFLFFILRTGEIGRSLYEKKLLGVLAASSLLFLMLSVTLNYLQSKFFEQNPLNVRIDHLCGYFSLLGLIGVICILGRFAELYLKNRNKKHSRSDQSNS